jgi:hypothetical protein
MATKRYTLPVVAKIEFTHIFNGIFNINVREKKDYVWEEVEFEYCQDHQKEERQGRNSPKSDSKAFGRLLCSRPKAKMDS